MSTSIYGASSCVTSMAESAERFDSIGEQRHMYHWEVSCFNYLWNVSNRRNYLFLALLLNPLLLMDCVLFSSMRRIDVRSKSTGNAYSHQTHSAKRRGKRATGRREGYVSSPSKLTYWTEFDGEKHC